MGEMRFRALFIENGKSIHRKCGFHCRSVVAYYESNLPNYICVVLAVDRVRETVYVHCTVDEFYLEKLKAEKEEAQEIFYKSRN